MGQTWHTCLKPAHQRSESAYASQDRLLFLPPEPMGLYRPRAVHGDRGAARGRDQLQAGLSRAGLCRNRWSAAGAAASGAAAISDGRTSTLARKAGPLLQPSTQALAV